MKEKFNAWLSKHKKMQELKTEYGQVSNEMNRIASYSKTITDDISKLKAVRVIVENKYRRLQEIDNEMQELKGKEKHHDI